MGLLSVLYVIKVKKVARTSFSNVLSPGLLGIGGGKLGSMLVFMRTLWLSFGKVLVDPLLRLPFWRWFGVLVQDLLSGRCGWKGTIGFSRISQRGCNRCGCK